MEALPTPAAPPTPVVTTGSEERLLAGVRAAHRAITRTSSRMTENLDADATAVSMAGICLDGHTPQDVFLLAAEICARNPRMAIHALNWSQLQGPRPGEGTFKLVITVNPVDAETGENDLPHPTVM